MDEGLLQCHHGSWTQQFPARNYQYCEGHHKSLCISRVKENNFFKLISHHLSNIFLKIVSNKTFLKFDIIYINLHTELNGLIFFFLFRILPWLWNSIYTIYLLSFLHHDFKVTFNFFLHVAVFDQRPQCFLCKFSLQTLWNFLPWFTHALQNH